MEFIFKIPILKYLGNVRAYRIPTLYVKYFFKKSKQNRRVFIKTKT